MSTSSPGRRWRPGWGRAWDVVAVGAVDARPIGIPWRSTATDHFQPNFARSVGLGPVPSPPQGALCKLPSRATSLRSSPMIRSNAASASARAGRTLRLRSIHRVGLAAWCRRPDSRGSLRCRPTTSRSSAGPGSPRSTTGPGPAVGDSPADASSGDREQGLDRCPQDIHHLGLQSAHDGGDLHWSSCVASTRIKRGAARRPVDGHLSRES